MDFFLFEELIITVVVVVFVFIRKGISRESIKEAIAKIKSRKK